MRTTFNQGKYDEFERLNDRQREAIRGEILARLPADPDQMELLAKGEHMAERMLTLREVSAYLNVNPATVRRLVRTGQLRAIRVGRDMRFEVRVVDQWVAGGGTLPGQPEPTVKIDSGTVRKTIKS